MASYKKRGNKWRAFVRRNGISKSATFFSKTDAIKWATQIEVDILSERFGLTVKKTVSEMMKRYAETISPQKKREQSDLSVVKQIRGSPLASLQLSLVKPKHVVEWRDALIQRTSSATAIRYLRVLKHAFNLAIQEWGWLKNNPFSGVKMPATPKPRERRITKEELTLLLKHSQYTKDGILEKTRQRVGASILFAIETAMRRGEIIGLTWENVDFKNRVAFLPETKNGSSRKVPLSREAIRILNQLPYLGEKCFCIKESNFMRIFSDLIKKAGIHNLHFHDTRHEAITRLAKKLNVLDLARMVGHKDIKMLMVYYNATAEEIAKLLD